MPHTQVKWVAPSKKDISIEEAEVEEKSEVRRLRSEAEVPLGTAFAKLPNLLVLKELDKIFIVFADP